MTLPTSDTLVTFPAGDTVADTVVLHAWRSSAGIGVLTQVTSFHPVDHRWPDQGPDAGTLTVAVGGTGQFGTGSVRSGPIGSTATAVPVIDVVLGATDGTELYVGDEMPVRRGTAGWAFVVVHLLPPDGGMPVVGARVTLTVDAATRSAVSAGHTGCHLASLALNSALADRWRKDVAPDALGQPNFDQAAITSSSIRPDGSVDEYRLGKSLRKKGFDSEGLAAALPVAAARVNSTLAGWLQHAGAVRVECAGPALSDRREWVAELPAGVVRIACGGTHVTSLAELTSARVELAVDQPSGSLTMTTTVVRR